MNMMCASRVIAGVVDQDVDRPELLRRPRRRTPCTARSSRDVALRRPRRGRRARAPLDRPPRAGVVLLAIGDGDRRAALGQQLGDAAADAARAAGDDGDAAVELKIVEGHVFDEAGTHEDQYQAVDSVTTAQPIEVPLAATARSAARR